MHAYITDSDERMNVPLLLVAIAIALSLSLSSVIESFKVSIPGWVDITSVPLLYGVFYGAFDKYCWRWPALRRMGIVKVPVIDGEWNGYVLSSFDEFRTQHNIQMRIEQRWSRIRISLEGEVSRSYSTLAGVFTEAHDGVVLDYEYQNEPLPGAGEAMQIHHGTARLRLTSGTIMEGYYYTGRGRGNHGSVHLNRSR